MKVPAIDDHEMRDLAKAIVLHCFRNNVSPEIARTGDFSVVDAKDPTADAVNNVYSVLRHLEDPEFRQHFIRVSLGGVGGWREPVRSKAIEAFATPSQAAPAEMLDEPVYALVVEAVLQLKSGYGAPLLVFDARSNSEAQATPTYDRRTVTVRQLPRGRTFKRRYPSFVGDMLDGNVQLLDPDGNRLHLGRSIGSLLGASDAPWRSGKGPAAALSPARLLAFLSDPATAICVSGYHYPVVVAVSRDGWLHSSRLADVPGDDDDARIAACLDAAAALEPTCVFLVDVTSSDPLRRLLLPFVTRGRSEIFDAGARDRELAASLAARLPPVEDGPDRGETLRKQLERADLFLKEAVGLFG